MAQFRFLVSDLHVKHFVVPVARLLQVGSDVRILIDPRRRQPTGTWRCGSLNRGRHRDGSSSRGTLHEISPVYVLHNSFSFDLPAASYSLAFLEFHPTEFAEHSAATLSNQVI